MIRLRIIGLWRYPIKSCAGQSLDSLELDRMGPRLDRRWMLIDGSRRFIRQSECPAMARLRIDATRDGIAVRFDGGPPFAIASATADEQNTGAAQIWRDTCDVIDEGDEAARWFSEHLGRECRLVRAGAGFERQVSRDYGRPGDRTSLTDGFPLTLAVRESVDDLNRRITARGADTVPVERFRPNILVEGADAPLPVDPRIPVRDGNGDRMVTLPEDTWKRLELRRGDRTETYRSVKPSARCAITTLDQNSGAAMGAEPLATLATYRFRAPRSDDSHPEAKVLFCWNLIHDYSENAGPMLLRVGDILEAE